MRKELQAKKYVKATDYYTVETFRANFENLENITKLGLQPCFCVQIKKYGNCSC